MIMRREFLLGLAALCASAAHAQTPVSKQMRVGILVESTQAKHQAIDKYFVDAMRELGWVEDRNITYDRVFADDDAAKLPALAEILIARKPDLIFAPYAGPLEAVHAKTRTVPLVAGAATSIVERGMAKSLAHPGGNVTGIQTIGWELSGKRVQLLNMAHPKAIRVGVLLASEQRSSAQELQLIEQAASKLKITLIPSQIKQGSDLESAFAVFAKNRIDAVLVTHNTLFIIRERKHILTLAEKHRLPVIGPRSEFTEEGALMSYSSILADQHRRAAQLADKILRGAKPADVPIEQPTKFELAINQKTAKALGIKFPSSILLQATRVIE
jgi:putative ABC transport system substrate-binding protein